MKKLCSVMLVCLLMMVPLTVRAEDVIPVYTSDSIQSVTYDEFDMIAKIVYAEAGNQDWEAQWAVACVVLNRVESDKFPDSIREVIFQDKPVKQFCCVWDGGYDRAAPGDAVYEAVAYAIEQERYPTDVLYFTSNGYLKGTEPYESIDDMYFSR